MSGAILAMILLFFAFYLKLTVNRKVTLPGFLTSIAELPVDIMFTSTTFIISFRVMNAVEILEKEDYSKFDLNSDLTYFIVYLLITAVVITLWRYSIENMDKSKWIWFSGLVFLAYVISILTLINALTKMNGVV